MKRKVIYTGKGGYESDKIHADKYLIVGNVYTIYKEDIGDWSTKIYLEEIKDQYPSGFRVYFNSVMFRDENKKESEAEYIERVKPSLEELFEHKKNDPIEEACVRFLDSIRDYERESGHSICYDERSSKELYNIFLESGE